MEKPMTADLVSEIELQKAADVLREKFDVVRIILFGSKANGTASKDSDIDLCIIIKPSPKRILDVKTPCADRSVRLHSATCRAFFSQPREYSTIQFVYLLIRE